MLPILIVEIIVIVLLVKFVLWDFLYGLYMYFLSDAIALDANGLRQIANDLGLTRNQVADLVNKLQYTSTGVSDLKTAIDDIKNKVATSGGALNTGDMTKLVNDVISSKVLSGLNVNGEITSGGNITTNYINAKTGFETGGSVQAIGNLVSDGSIVSRKGELCLTNKCLNTDRLFMGTNETPWDYLPYADSYLLTRMNSEGNAECGSENGRDCIVADKATLQKYKIEKPKWVNALMCGDHHMSVYGSTGYESPGSWCNNTLMKYGRTPPV
jgi:hypothetical protein